MSPDVAWKASCGALRRALFEILERRLRSGSLGQQFRSERSELVVHPRFQIEPCVAWGLRRSFGAPNSSPASLGVVSRPGRIPVPKARPFGPAFRDPGRTVVLLVQLAVHVAPILVPVRLQNVEVLVWQEGHSYRLVAVAGQAE